MMRAVTGVGRSAGGPSFLNTLGSLITTDPLLLSQKQRSIMTNQTNVVLGHNGALFGTALSTTTKKKQTTQAYYQRPFWLDQVHSRFHDKLWGQTVSSMPQAVIPMIKLILPHKSMDERMHWGDIIALRQLAKDMIQASNIDFIDATQSFSVAPNENQLLITASGEGQTIMKQAYSSNTVLIDWAKDFRQVSMDQLPPGVMQPPSSTTLYEREPQDVPDNIIVIGDGPTVVWLAQHCPESKVHYLTRSPNEMMYIGSFGHKDTYNSNLQKIAYDPKNNPDDLHRLQQNDDGTVNLTLDNGTTINGELFSAIGYEQQPLSVPSNTTVITPNSEQGNRTNPEPVPNGSLNESIARLFLVTGNAAQAVNMMEYFKSSDNESPLNSSKEFNKIVTNKISSFNIHKFTDALDQAITPQRCQSSKKLLSGIDFHPVPKEIIKIYQDAFAASHPKATEKEKTTFTKIIENNIKAIERHQQRTMDTLGEAVGKKQKAIKKLKRSFKLKKKPEPNAKTTSGKKKQGKPSA